MLNLFPQLRVVEVKITLCDDFFDNWRREVAEVEISASDRLEIPWIERVRWEMGSSYGGGIGAREGVQ